MSSLLQLEYWGPRQPLAAVLLSIHYVVPAGIFFPSGSACFIYSCKVFTSMLKNLVSEQTKWHLKLSKEN